MLLPNLAKVDFFHVEKAKWSQIARFLLGEDCVVTAIGCVWAEPGATAGKVNRLSLRRNALENTGPSEGVPVCSS